jgi:anti-sigma B factor antagonist
MELLESELVPGEPSVLLLRGELDISTADELRRALSEALSVDPKVVVDMAGVSFIDASGLRVVLDAAESLDGARPLTLIDAPRVAWMLTVVGLSDLPSIEVRDGR